MGFLSEVTNSTLHNITDTNFRNSAGAIASIIASSGNYNYDWGVFAGTAIGLLFILPFTMAVGTMMRTTVVSVVRYINNWRALTLLIAGHFLLAVVATSALGAFLSRVFWVRFLDELSDPWDGWWVEYGQSHRWTSNWGGLGDYEGYGSWLFLIGLPKACCFVGAKERSVSSGQHNYSSQSLCFTIDFMLSTYPLFPFMIIPWIWLGVFNACVRRHWW